MYPSGDMASYMAARRAERRSVLIKMLGGRCVDCGIRENLEFDHRSPAHKRFTVSSGLSGNWDALVREAKKCDLRCRSCHNKRTALLGHGKRFGRKNHRWVPALHGTSKRYDLGCKCQKCRDWKRLYRLKKVDSQGLPRK